MADAVPWMDNVDSFVAAKYALENIWYGHANPILRGMEWAAGKRHPDADEREVAQALLHFAEELDKALQRLPEQVRRDRSQMPALLEKALRHKQEEIVELRQQVLEKKGEITVLKGHLTKLQHRKQEWEEECRKAREGILLLEKTGLRIVIEAEPGYAQGTSEQEIQALIEDMTEVLSQ